MEVRTFIKQLAEMPGRMQCVPMGLQLQQTAETFSKRSPRLFKSREKWPWQLQAEQLLG